MSKVRMRFKRYGNSFHLKITNAAELFHAAKLNEAHWLANNAPIVSLNADATLLELCDTDRNGRITCHELRDAIDWIAAVLCEYDGITEKRDVLDLSAINTECDAGKQIYDAGAKLLANIGESDSGAVRLAQVREVKAEVVARPVSAAGVVLPTATDDADLRQFLSDVVGTLGGSGHPAGTSGVSAADLSAFMAKSRDYLTWHEQGQLGAGQQRSDIMPLGVDTPGRYALFAELRPQFDRFFAQAQTLLLDERLAARMGLTADAIQGLDFNNPAGLTEFMRQTPLALPVPGGAFDFAGKVNPYYAETLKRFYDEVVKAVLGDIGSTLSAVQWRQIVSFFADHARWAEAKPAAELESLGVETLRHYLDGDYVQRTEALIAQCVETALALDHVIQLEKAVLYQAHLIDLANNFISFPNLYDTHKRAMFEMGSLVVDGRWFHFAVRVDDRKLHSDIASTSNMFVLYVQVMQPDGKVRYEIALPVTSGGKGDLCLHKRGVFYDVNGNEYDAKIVQMVENPISFIEAVLSPFRRLGKLLTGKIEAITASAEKKFDTQTTGAMEQVTAAPVPAAAPAAPVDSAKPNAMAAGGMVMGTGVALAALGSAVAYVTKTISQVHWLTIVLTVVVALLLVMLPTSIVALLKLRKRDLAAILEGAGWGINLPMRLSRRQARFFTQRPRYPRGSRGFLYW